MLVSGIEPGLPYVFFSSIYIFLSTKIEIYKNLVHWEDLEGAGGEGGWRGDRDGEYM